MSRLKSIALCCLIAGLSCVAASAQKPFLDWNSLHNPVLSYPDWSIKDAAMAYRDGTFYVFFSAFYPKDSGTISHVVEVSTRDFKTYSKPIFDIDGTDDGWLGLCSPDVQQLNGQYVMTFNSWGDKPGKPNELFYETSPDLVHWSKRRTLAVNLTGDTRVIDPALATADGGYYLMWKEGKEGKMKPRMAFSKAVDGPYEFVGTGLPDLLWTDGKDITGNPPSYHENYEFLHVDGQWYLVTTDHGVQKGPLGPFIYKLEPGSHWLKWTGGHQVDPAVEGFNTVDRDNAAAIYDWRQYDGYFYMLYAGASERVEYSRRGWNRLGLARSKDMIHWSVPGEKEK